MKKYFWPIAVLSVCLTGINEATTTAITHKDSGVGVWLAEEGGILDGLYGLSNLVRVDDYSAKVTDQYWSVTAKDGLANAVAVAKYAGFTHEFGILSGMEGNNFVSLFSSGESQNGTYKNKNKTPEGSFTSSDAGNVFRFGLDLTSQPGYRWSSAISDNLVMPGGYRGDGADHMVTYQIVSADKKHKDNMIGNYIVAWEDLSLYNTIGNYDGDYGDLVIEVFGAAPAVVSVPIPEPSTFVLFALGGVVWHLNHRRKRAHA